MKIISSLFLITFGFMAATTSIAIDGTVLGCLRLLDTDGGGYTNITTLNGNIGTSTDAVCGF